MMLSSKDLRAEVLNKTFFSFLFLLCGIVALLINNYYIKVFGILSLATSVFNYLDCKTAILRLEIRGEDERKDQF